MIIIKCERNVMMIIFSVYCVDRFENLIVNYSRDTLSVEQVLQNTCLNGHIIHINTESIVTWYISKKS